MLDFKKLQDYRETNKKVISGKVSALLEEPAPQVETIDWFKLTDYAILDTPISDKFVNERLKLLRDAYDHFPDHRFASVCFYPNHITGAIKHLKNTKSAIAAVTGNFPTGQTNLRSKLLETRLAIDEGANEIDYCYDIGNMIDEEYEWVYDEISAVKDVCRNTPLKVIIETGDLSGNKAIRIATEIALHAGANFVKTSTGKMAEGATHEGVYSMMTVLKTFFEETGERRGIKVSGGIKSHKEALNFLKLQSGILGRDWLNPNEIRIGAGGMAFQMVNSILAKDQ